MWLWMLLPLYCLLLALLFPSQDRVQQLFICWVFRVKFIKASFVGLVQIEHSDDPTLSEAGKCGRGSLLGLRHSIIIRHLANVLPTGSNEGSSAR